MLHTDTHTRTHTHPSFPALSSNIIKLEEAAGQSSLWPASDVARLDSSRDESSGAIRVVLNTTPDPLLSGKGTSITHLEPLAKHLILTVMD